MEQRHAGIDGERLGRAIAEVRVARRVSQSELARAVGLTQNYLSLLEHGRRGVSIDGLCRIAGRLGVPPVVLLVLGSATVPEEGEGMDVVRRMSAIARGYVDALAVREVERSQTTRRPKPSEEFQSWIPGF
ncbi:MAG: helix-turn-helix domain-containing protein [Phycisphaerae bacterium]|nr:helix-turn-helix domain-containing protein [Phycisphaerae bacterium]